MKIIKEKSTGLVVYFFNDDDDVSVIDDGLKTDSFVALDIKTDTHELIENLPDFNDKVGGKYTYNGINFSIYVQPTVIITTPKIITPIAFKLRFTAQERVAIYSSTDLIVIDFRMLLDDSRLHTIDLNLDTTVEAVNYLASKELIEAARVNEILS